jgi:hypothetical protein
MNPFFYSEEAGAKGLPPLSPAPPIPAEPASASLRTISLDDSEHLLHNHHASVAALRLLFTFAPERRSASFRNRCSPSPEYPETIIALCDLHIGSEYPTLIQGIAKSVDACLQDGFDLEPFLNHYQASEHAEPSTSQRFFGRGTVLPEN